MAAIKKDDLDQFRIRFGELARVRRGEPVQIDPFLIARAIALVMGECTVRSAAGRPITWNQYRLILARRDYDSIRPLQALLERDLRQVLAEEARSRQAELVGELRVTVVADEADELPAGEGVARVAFVPTERLEQPRPGEMTVRLDGWAVAGEIAARAPARPGSAGGAPGVAAETVMVGDAAGPGCALRWAGGAAALVLGAPVVVGRPHPEQPAYFIALAGAGAKVNKLHFWIEARPDRVRIGRFAKANPVHANGQAIRAGEELEVTLPAEISLSHGDLVLSVSRT
jgi:hypothetical protein